MKQLTLLPALLLLAIQQVAADEGKIRAVETGLRPVVVIEGDPAWTLEERMAHYGVPAVGIAVIEDFQIAWSKTYGLADRLEGTPASSSTLFQAGSVSKPVAAFGAMLMVSRGQLSLDANVNDALKTWKLPDNEFTRQQSVNLTHLLSHTGGLTVHGFLGYADGQEVPTLVQVLDGSGPANSDPIRVDKLPGKSYRYSGGGYSIAQQMMVDSAGQHFPELMQSLLLAPAGMQQSTFDQPLNSAQLILAAAGVLPGGQDVPGKRNVYPEMAAAGLWSTAEDLARFAIAMQDALRGKNELLGQNLANRMITPVDANYGLGFFVNQRGEDIYFSHGGWDVGFCAQLTAHSQNGYGMVVMINSNHPAFMSEVERAIAYTYGWGGYETHVQQSIPADLLGAAPGRYRYNSELPMSVSAEDGRLFMHYAGSPPEEMFYVGDGRFMRRERPPPIRFDTSGETTTLNFVMDNGELQTHALIAGDEKLPRDLLLAGKFDEAVSAYKAIGEADPEDAAGQESYIMRQGLDLLKDNPELAISMLKVNTVLYPESALTWSSIGYAYREIGDTARALLFYREALKRDAELSGVKQAIKELEAEE